MEVNGSSCMEEHHEKSDTVLRVLESGRLEVFSKTAAVETSG